MGPVSIPASICMIVTPVCSDRKSTRLNSSHSQISYAVFCLKKNIHMALRNRLQNLLAPDIITTLHARSAQTAPLYLLHHGWLLNFGVRLLSGAPRLPRVRQG